MAEFKRGDRIKCIDDHFVDEKTNPFKKSEITLPEKGKTYTIRSVIDTPYGDGLRLKEIKNKKFYFDNIQKYQEPIFSTERFVLS